jgi:NAD(P)-dependent dehydrogenase (short-subunit alcohol dehydrogenase family)
MTGSWVNDKERYQWMMNMTPMKRLGAVEDLAGPVVFLSSDWSQFVTGINLPVDGGWTAH